MKRVIILLSIMAASIAHGQMFAMTFGNRESAWAPRLPVAYQEVEYLESTGTQWIDTGYTHSGNCIYSVSCALMSRTPAYQQVVGRMGDNTHIGCNSGGMSWQSRYSSGFSNPGSPVTIGTKYSVTLARGEFTVDGTSYPFTPAVGVYAETKVLFGLGSWRVYAFGVIELPGTPVRDLVPVVRKSDSMAGMYDHISEQFFTNQGTGDFLVGPNIED